MAVAGHEMRSCTDHHARAVKTALDFMRAAKEIKSPLADGSLSLRIGLHTGPAVGSVLGSVGPRYDLYGKTVDIALEAMRSSPRQCVQLSDTTYAALQDNSSVLEAVKAHHHTGVFVSTGEGAAGAWLLGCGDHGIELAEGPGLPQPGRFTSEGSDTSE